MITVENLSFTYRKSKRAVLRDFSLSFESGRVYGLLGKNGAGKSTLLYLMSGLLTPKNGKVMFHDTDVRRRLPVTLQDMFLVPEEFELPSVSLVSYIELNSPFYPRFSKEEMIKYLHYFEMDIDIDLGSLSMGQKKKVFMSFALATNTSLLLMDEPTNGLDPNQIVEIRHLIKEIAEERTVILSTHILSEVQATCDYIRMIEEGQVVFAGTVEEFDNYIVPNTIFVSLASAPPVDELKMLSGVEDAVSMGGMDYRVNFSDSREAITQIVEASVTRNWQLLEIRMEKSSMDSVFAELSAKSKNR